MTSYVSYEYLGIHAYYIAIVYAHFRQASSELMPIFPYLPLRLFHMIAWPLSHQSQDHVYK